MNRFLLLGKWQKLSSNHEISLKYVISKSNNNKQLNALPPNKRRRISPKSVPISEIMKSSSIAQKKQDITNKEMHQIARAETSKNIHFLRVTNNFVIYVDYIFPKQYINHPISRIHVMFFFYFSLFLGLKLCTKQHKNT